MARPISPRTLAVLTFVADKVERTGVAPSMREIVDAGVGITSTSVAAYHLDRLARAGLLTRESAISRGLAMTDAGYRALGRRPRVADAALGRALRRAARRDPLAAGVLAELEVA